MDPANPRPVRRDSMSLGQVQQWILSTLAVTTIMHLALGFVVAAWWAGSADLTPRIGMLVVAGMFGTVAIAAGLAIHRRPLVSPWLLLGWIPALVGLWLVLG